MAGVLMPAIQIGSGIGVPIKRRDIGRIVLEIDRPNELIRWSHSLELWDSRVPRLRVARLINARKIRLVAKLNVDRVAAEDSLCQRDQVAIVGQRVRVSRS